MLSISKDHLLSRLLHIGNLFCKGTPEQGSLGSLWVPLDFFRTHKVDYILILINYRAPLAKICSGVPVVIFIYAVPRQHLYNRGVIIGKKRKWAYLKSNKLNNQMVSESIENARQTMIRISISIL